MNSDTGKYIIMAGAMIVLLGVVIYFFHDKLNWIGRLPGDIRIEKENFKFYFPITTLIIFSVLITTIIQIIRKVF
jgi:O-antigen/teichoic acid export membrane protein